MDASELTNGVTDTGRKLLPGVQAVLDRPTDQRIILTKTEVWIDYQNAKLAITALNDLLIHPRAEEMPGLLIAAESRNGKSSLLRKFQQDHLGNMGEAGRLNMPVVRVRMSDKPDAGAFWTAVLNAMKVGHQVKAPVPVKKDQAQRTLENVRCRMLMIDEIHNILQGKAPEQRHFLALLEKH